MLAIALLLPGRAWAPPPAFAVVQDDGIQWKFAQPSKIVSIGDVHADPHALLQILAHRGLINNAGKWTGGKSHLVLMGDFVDRGPGSRRVLDMVIRLENEALAAGGRVHSLVGNHDVMVLQGDLRYSKPSERKDYADFQNAPEAKRAADAISKYDYATVDGIGMTAAFMGDSKYAKWLRGRNSVIMIGGKVYAHAGLSECALTVTPGEINSTVRKWISHLQGVESKPDTATYWVMGEPHSPFWNRSQAFDGGFSPDMTKYLADVGAKRMDQATLEKILAHLNAEQLIIAHSPTASMKIETHYNGKVVRLDTNISIGYGGNLSAMEERSGKQTFFDEIPRPTNRGKIFSAICRAIGIQIPP